MGKGHVIKNASGLVFPFGRPRILDLTITDADLAKTAGGFFDGRYIYTCPVTPASKIGRIDTRDFSSVSVLDLAITDATLTNMNPLGTDGKYGYFTYAGNGGANAGKVARVDLEDFSTVTVLDMALTDSSYKGYHGGFIVGKYAYLAPYNSGSPHGKVARIDLDDFSTVTALDLTSSDSDLKGFEGGCTDGKYGYFSPAYNGARFGKVPKIDLATFTYVGQVNLANISTTLESYEGGILTDGNYLYLIPHYNDGYFGKFVRISLSDFTEHGVTVLDTTTVNSNLKGYMGGFIAGRYLYAIQQRVTTASPPSGISAYWTRIDLDNFTTSGVEWRDFSVYDSELKGNGFGLFDGTYAYILSNWYGKVARFLAMYSGER